MSSQFATFMDEALSIPTPYHDNTDYFRRARARIEATDRVVGDVTGRSVLDIGASPFYLSYLFQLRGAADVNGTYFSNDDHPLRNVHRIYSGAGAINLRHSDIESEALPFDDESMDLVTACEILEHLEYFPENFAKEVLRVLRPGGKLCITVPNVASISNIKKLITHNNIYMRYRDDGAGRHKHEYTIRQLADLIYYMGMSIEKMGYLPTRTSNRTWKSSAYRLLANLPLLRAYSPVLFVVAVLPRGEKPMLKARPKSLYVDSRSIEQ